MYIYLLSPIIAFTIAQGTKIIIKTNHQRITWKDIFSYSDMPSGHTAVVVALTSIIAFKLGLESPSFSIALVFSSIVITDAIGLRNYLGKHGKTLNILVKDLGEDKFIDKSYPIQLEKIGHTPLQVIVGGLIGLIVSTVAYLLF